jgi:MoaA/NifB/PqqE/SkfB family radical SAM enzyme
MKLFPISSLIGRIIKNTLGRPTPLVLAHEVTGECNLKCKFCTYWRERKKDKMDLEEIKGIVSQAKELGVGMYCVTGGEPLLRSDIVEIVRYASSENMITSLISNGVLLADKISDIAPHLNFLTISIDTLNSEKYKNLRGYDCLDKVLASVDKYIEVKDDFPGMNVNINSVLMEETLNEVFDLVNFAADRGVGITFEPVVPQNVEGCPTWGSEEDFDRVLKEILQLKKEHNKIIWNSEYYLRWLLERKRYICHSETLIRVDSTGNVTAPCYDHHDSKVIGNACEKGLKEILETDVAKALHAKAHNCDRHDCYLMCYAEPSLVMESKIFALKGLYYMLNKLI